MFAITLTRVAHQIDKQRFVRGIAVKIADRSDAIGRKLLERLEGGYFESPSKLWFFLLEAVKEDKAAVELGVELFSAWCL